MTSQIALLNYAGIAVASDSNVSIGNRTYARTKIYQLAGRQPVGFMTSGTASYLDIPLSTLFGEFRDHYDRQNPHNAELDHLSDYVGNLRKFLTTYQGEGNLTNTKNITVQQRDVFEYELTAYLRRVFASLVAYDRWNNLLDSDDELHPLLWWKFDTDDKISRALGIEADDSGAIRSMIEKNIEDNLKNEIFEFHGIQKNLYPKKLKSNYYNLNEPWDEKKREMSQIYSSIVNPTISKFITTWGLPKTKTTPLLREILYYYLCDDKNIRYPTTITIFGFGKKENKPSLIKLKIGPWRSNRDCCLVSEYNRISTLTEHRWGYTDVPESVPSMNYDGNVSYAHAFICPIAQVEEMSATLSGVHSSITRGATKSTKKELRNLMKYRWNTFRRIASTLPTSELATFAETLINLESSIAYLSRASRGVGGPTTVATITKADGFLWVKSEESVDYTLNPRQQVAPRHSAHLK